MPGTVPRSWGRDPVRRRLSLAGLLIAAALLAAPPGAVAAAGDLDGDGRADLAVGAPGDTVEGHDGAGSVSVFYGGPGGLGPAGDQLWSQGSPGVRGAPGDGNSFGSAVAIGNFDGDRFADLAIGVPGDEADGNPGGLINVLYGSSSGLTASGDEYFSTTNPGVSDSLGLSLAAGDFDRDRRTDLAAGDPFEGLAGANTGTVYLFEGSPKGLDPTDSTSSTVSGQYWQGLEGVEGAPASGEQFGASLTAGDLDGDRHADLAIGVPVDTVGPDAGAGSVNVLYGSRAGLSLRGDQLFNQDSQAVIDGTLVEVEGGSEPGDHFGGALAAGRIDADGTADLVIGVRDENLGLGGEGAIHAIYGSPAGLTIEGSQLWTRDTGTIGGTAGAGDEFGAAVALGDLNGDGRADLSVGAPGDSADAGTVNTIPGSDAGLTDVGNNFLSSGFSLGANSSGDRLGQQLAVGRFDNGKTADLAMAAPGEELPAEDPADPDVPLAGAVSVLYELFPAGPPEFLYRSLPGVAGAPDPNDFFGHGLSSVAAR